MKKILLVIITLATMSPWAEARTYRCTATGDASDALFGCMGPKRRAEKCAYAECRGDGNLACEVDSSSWSTPMSSVTYCAAAAVAYPK